MGIKLTKSTSYVWQVDKFMGRLDHRMGMGEWEWREWKWGEWEGENEKTMFGLKECVLGIGKSMREKLFKLLICHLVN